MLEPLGLRWVTRLPLYLNLATCRLNRSIDTIRSELFGRPSWADDAGRYYMHGCPLEETDFIEDPELRAKTSRVVDLLGPLDIGKAVSAQVEERMRAGVEADGGVTRLYGPNQTPALVAGASATAPGGFIEVFNPGGQRTFSTSVEAGGGGRLDLANGEGGVVFSINAGPAQGAAMALMNPAGEKLFLVGARGTGGLMNLMNDQGDVVFIAGPAAGHDGGAISIKNGSGKQVFYAGVREGEEGIVSVWDAKGERRGSVTPWRY